jgi:hypothetical protein
MLNVTTFIIALFSFSGSSFICLVWFFFVEVRNDNINLIACLSMADVLSAGFLPSWSGFISCENKKLSSDSSFLGVWLLASSSNVSSEICFLQAALAQFTDVAIILWVACIAVHIHAMVLNFPEILAEPGFWLLRQRVCVEISELITFQLQILYTFASIAGNEKFVVLHFVIWGVRF